ncbi:hypothetical protein ACFQZZ_22430 [Nocardia sp. GCM10030253]|uniref:hypothetical protein n=1 Tax=Nocardia sp. GCM10030253 TaxID=3273404 RepID=UPI0036432CD7
MSSTVRVSIAMVIGYLAYLAAAFLVGDRPDDVGDWVKLLVKGFLVVLIAVSAVEWVAKRRSRGLDVRR